MRPFIFIVISCVWAAACASPSPAFMNASKSVQIVGGWTYDVYVLPDRAQAIRRRVGAQSMDMELGQLRGLAAIEEASGCSVARGSMRGDPVVMTAKLKC